MALSQCPGCGAITEHAADDASAFYEHVAGCKPAKVAMQGEAAAHNPQLDKLWDELRSLSPGGPLSMEAKQRMEALFQLPLDFDGAVRDYLNLAEDVHMQTFLKLLAMIPSIIGSVKQAEDTIVGPGKGPHKLNLVLNTVNAAVAAVPEVQQSFARHDLNGTVTAIVAGAVNAMNAAKQPQPADGQ